MVDRPTIDVAECRAECQNLPNTSRGCTGRDTSGVTSNNQT
jgi:hypothetical protein